MVTRRWCLMIQCCWQVASLDIFIHLFRFESRWNVLFSLLDSLFHRHFVVWWAIVICEEQSYISLHILDSQTFLLLLYQGGCLFQRFCFLSLFLIGRLTVNDVFPIFATSTEDKTVERLSDPNIEVGRFSKNPGLQGYSRIVYPFLLSPYPRQGFELKHMPC